MSAMKMKHQRIRPDTLKPRALFALDWMALTLIGFYQRQLSPRKGWRCAYSVLHGGPGCSGFARESIETYGWRRSLPRVRQRFRDCKHAAHTIRAARTIRALSQDDPFEPNPSNPLPVPDERRKPRRDVAPRANTSGDPCAPDCSEPWCSACGALPDLSHAHHCAPGFCDAGICDHCHIADCGPCDCSCWN